MTHWSFPWAYSMDISAAMVRQWTVACGRHVSEHRLSMTPTCPTCEAHQRGVASMMTLYAPLSSEEARLYED